MAEFLGLFVKSLPEMESGGSNVCVVGAPHSQGEAGPGCFIPSVKDASVPGSGLMQSDRGQTVSDAGGGALCTRPAN